LEPFIIDATQDNAFRSNIAQGLLQFTVPALNKVWKDFPPNAEGVWSFTVSVLGMNGMEIKCNSNGMTPCALHY